MAPVSHLPPAVENRVNELLKNPSLGVIPNPVIHVIVAAVHMENEVPEPEMSLKEVCRICGLCPF